MAQYSLLTRSAVPTIYHRNGEVSSQSYGKIPDVTEKKTPKEIHRVVELVFN